MDRSLVRTMTHDTCPPKTRFLPFPCTHRPIYESILSHTSSTLDSSFFILPSLCSNSQFTHKWLQPPRTISSSTASASSPTTTTTTTTPSSPITPSRAPNPSPSSKPSSHHSPRVLLSPKQQPPAPSSPRSCRRPPQDHRTRTRQRFPRGVIIKIICWVRCQRGRRGSLGPRRSPRRPSSPPTRPISGEWCRR